MHLKNIYKIQKRKKNHGDTTCTNTFVVCLWFFLSWYVLNVQDEEFYHFSRAFIP